MTNNSFNSHSIKTLPPYDISYLKKNLNISLIHSHDIVTSTMDLIDKSNLEKQLIVAEYQTEGRGQRGKFWESFFGCQLMFSYGPCRSLHPGVKVPSRIFYQDIYQVLLKVNKDILFKAPNDFYHKGKKISGMLLECYKGHYYCHMGLNLLPVEQNKYGSLLEENIKYESKIREKILINIIESIS